MIRPIILPLVVLFISCSSRSGQNQTTKDTVQLANPSHQDSIARQDSTRIKISLSDTLIVDQRCAVFYVADSAQAEKRLRLGGKDTVGGDGAGDDNAYYMDLTTKFLDKHKVKMLSADGKKYILFKSQGNVSGIINTDTLKELVDVFLFNPRKGFINTDIVNIEGDFNKLFK